MSLEVDACAKGSEADLECPVVVETPETEVPAELMEDILPELEQGENRDAFDEEGEPGREVEGDVSVLRSVDFFLPFSKVVEGVVLPPALLLEAASGSHVMYFRS